MFFPLFLRLRGTRGYLRIPQEVYTKHSPLRNTPPDDSPSCRFLSKHRTGMVPRHSKEFCGPETAWLEGKGSDSRSETQIQLCIVERKCYKD